jgi:hypothetical protein
VLIDKFKNLVPEMEKLIKESKKDGMERGFTFRTNEETKIEEICSTGSECQMIMKYIHKKKGTKTGNFHVHPHTTMKTKITHGIGGIFSCSDVFNQIGNNIDHACVGTNDEIICSTLKPEMKISLPKGLELYECTLLRDSILKHRKESENYAGSENEKNDIKKLDKIETDLDNKLKPYIDFELIKKLK